MEKEEEMEENVNQKKEMQEIRDVGKEEKGDYWRRRRGTGRSMMLGERVCRLKPKIRQTTNKKRNAKKSKGNRRKEIENDGKEW